MKKVSQSIVLLSAVALSFAVNAGPLEQAKRMHDRLAGVPADAATLDHLVSPLLPFTHHIWEKKLLTL